MAKHTDFGDIIAMLFKDAVKKKQKFLILNITNAGGIKQKVKVVAATPDSFDGYLANKASQGFSDNLTTFNPDLVGSFEVE